MQPHTHNVLDRTVWVSLSLSPTLLYRCARVFSNSGVYCIYVCVHMGVAQGAIMPHELYYRKQATICESNLIWSYVKWAQKSHFPLLLLRVQHARGRNQPAAISYCVSHCCAKTFPNECNLHASVYILYIHPALRARELSVYRNLILRWNIFLRSTHTHTFYASACVCVWILEGIARQKYYIEGARGQLHIRRSLRYANANNARRGWELRNKSCSCAL